MQIILRTIASAALALAVAGPARAQQVADMYQSLRTQALDTKAGDLAAAADPYGVVMEIGYDRGPVSVIAFATGDASIYVGSGGGMIGGIGHPPVAEAARKLVATAKVSAAGMAASNDRALPKVGEVVFYVLTRAGPRRAVRSQAVLAAGTDGLSALFFAGHEVVTQMRLADAGRRPAR